MKIWKCDVVQQENAICEICKRKVREDESSLLLLIEEEGEFGRAHICYECLEKRVGKKIKGKKGKKEKWISFSDLFLKKEKRI